MKICPKCNKRQPVINFYMRSNGKWHDSWCKKCVCKYKSQYYRKNIRLILVKQTKYRIENLDLINKRKKKQYLLIKENRPWYINWLSMRQRCNDKNTKFYKYYGGKGIKALLTLKGIKCLWFRDKAYFLKKPSLDRIDSSKNYTLKNCRFIEHSENSRLANFQRGYLK